ncbi:ester cyclase [Novosphingobium sp. Gsoil 351]|uniref:nuclear transport factor 2 family protein n=1 Tax=Novosphingobium sp. Gsoil 351 TaxID=2675225 RepID=UPI0018A83FB3|nr:ester cyclase [Novosphingobium sp. Gsoil 351]
MAHPQFDLPFNLPERPRVRRIRKASPAELTGRTQSLAGFEDRFTDIVDYIVRITDEIWQDRAVGYIRDTYDANCVVYSSYGVTRGAEAVVRNTIAGLAGAPDGDTNHLNVAWSGDEALGFYTAHLGYGFATNLAPSDYGPATGRRYSLRFAADCISAANKIHTEWLVRDNGAMVRQVGLDLDEAAQRVALKPAAEPYLISAPVPGASPPPLADAGEIESWARSLFERVWNARRLDRLAEFYAPHAIVHSASGRSAHGLAAISDLTLSVLAAIPDGEMSVNHVCWADETDGVIVAVRWVLTGTSARGGVLGNQLPVGRPVFMMGSSHLRLDGPRIVEEWTVFDEVAVMAMAYRG